MISGSIRGSSPWILTTISYFFSSFWRASLHRSVPVNLSENMIYWNNYNIKFARKSKPSWLPFRQDSDVIMTWAPNPRQHSAILSSSVATTIPRRHERDIRTPSNQQRERERVSKKENLCCKPFLSRWCSILFFFIGNVLCMTKANSVSF